MKITENKVSCIIAAYNEGPRIGAVLSVISGSSIIDEIIVVNDGSNDNTREIVEQYPNAQLVSYSQNKGKTFAVMTGLSRAKNDIVMLLDADLVDLNYKDIENLILPVVSGQADVSMSIWQNSALPCKILGIDLESGQRVFYKKIIPDLKILSKLPRYGLEVFINNIIVEKKLKLKIVNWDTVVAIRKSQKIGWWYGTFGDIKMTFQVVSTIPLSTLIFQIKDLKSLSIDNLQTSKYRFYYKDIIPKISKIKF